LTSGEQLRDFAYVEDVAEGLLRLGLAQANPGQIVDLATGQLTSVRRFIEVAAPVLGIPNHCLQFGTIAMPEREKDWDREQVPVAVRQLRRLTGWLPTTGIEQGIRKTRWFEFGASG
jgi:nucleoside-diphosphate-sugar epimerase